MVPAVLYFRLFCARWEGFFPSLYNSGSVLRTVFPTPPQNRVSSLSPGLSNVGSLSLTPECGIEVSSTISLVCNSYHSGRSIRGGGVGGRDSGPFGGFCLEKRESRTSIKLFVNR